MINVELQRTVVCSAGRQDPPKTSTPPHKATTCRSPSLTQTNVLLHVFFHAEMGLGCGYTRDKIFLNSSRHPFTILSAQGVLSGQVRARFHQVQAAAC